MVELRKPFTAETEVLELKEGQDHDVRFLGHPFRWYEEYLNRPPSDGTGKIHHISNVIDRKDGRVKLLKLSIPIMEQIARSCEVSTDIRCPECDIQYERDDNFCSKCGEELIGNLFENPGGKNGHYYHISVKAGKHLARKLERAPITEQDKPKILNAVIDLKSWGKYMDEKTGA